jgi:hypothetical protein
MILVLPDRTNNALARRLERNVLARERGPILFQLPEPTRETPNPDQVFMLLNLSKRRPSAVLCAQKSTDPKAFILLNHFNGSAKNIAAEVIEMALQYIEPRFCDYSHEIQFGEIGGDDDPIPWRLVENERCAWNERN